eukprot:3839936-Amphidinium_carterae.1
MVLSLPTLQAKWTRLGRASKVHSEPSGHLTIDILDFAPSGWTPPSSHTSIIKSSTSSSVLSSITRTTSRCTLNGSTWQTVGSTVSRLKSTADARGKGCSDCLRANQANNEVNFPAKAQPRRDPPSMTTDLAPAAKVHKVGDSVTHAGSSALVTKGDHAGNDG